MGGLATKSNVSQSLTVNKTLRRNVPETKLYSNSTLKTMLDKYKMVYVKPNDGTGGHGIMRVEKQGQRYQYQLKTFTQSYTSFDSLVRSMKKSMKRNPYVIQQGIHLLRRNGRLFDLRVMVQKNLKGNWETTGMIGRLGHPRKIVTNLCKGGKPMSIEVLMKPHVINMDSYKKNLETLGYRTARRLNQTFPRIKELGLDIGIDRNLHPWILEANPRPAIYGFKSLKDKNVYRKICRYQKGYGR
ncbi:YheC/D like ATP-grasp [Paenibacillus sp. 1_12]|uniref:YheC/YheD family protein n=1 Tax=Paenibacillus sp. 1_12 TaxID=1566278 RepID=UPI0008E5D8F4|nr:YheC/YheD family protein [Paenibacillus sp. 1_12]SFL59609.1 YheC/D like ATP-grasp [Paenibacillus sp. 1_12]